MEQHDNSKAWVQDAENWICQIKDVRQCKIDLDHSGEVTGVHVVSSMARDPKHIVRDVEGLLKARLDLDIYYKKIGIVQVVDGEHAPQIKQEIPESIPEVAIGKDVQPFRQEVVAQTPRVVPTTISRLICKSVSVRSGMDLIVEVELVNGSDSYIGTCKGANIAGNDLSLVAEATISAINKLLDGKVALSLSEIRDTDFSGDKVLLVAVDFVSGRNVEKLFGTCASQRNLHQAVVYSVLDAVNRKLAVSSSLEATG
jgi:hypothetical protein